MTVRILKKINNSSNGDNCKEMEGRLTLPMVKGLEHEIVDNLVTHLMAVPWEI